MDSGAESRELEGNPMLGGGELNWRWDRRQEREACRNQSALGCAVVKLSNR